jgi:hypothetical protein
MKQSITLVTIGIFLIFSACGKYEDQQDTPIPNTYDEIEIPSKEINLADSLKISLKWDSYADLDLYVQDPMGEWIWYKHKKSQSNGHLDLDDRSGKGKETIYWSANRIPKGIYKVCIKHNGGEQSNYTINIQTGSEIKVSEGTIRPGATIYIAEFTDKLKEIQNQDEQIEQLPSLKKN